MRTAHLTASLILLGAGLVAGACGGSGDSNNTSAACHKGDTRACLGPGACNGAQTCLPDHSGFGACDCGAGGAPGGGTGGGGAGGTGAAATGGTDAGAGAGGADASAGSGGTSTGGSSGSGGSAGWGNPGPGDSPCPTGTYINCSHQCGPYDPKCDTAVCTDSTGPTFGWNGTPHQITFRLPADPGHLCSQCTTPPYELVVHIDDENYGYAVRVEFDGDGWQSALLPITTNGAPYSCPAGADMKPGCQYYLLPGPTASRGWGDLYIAPYDPSHPDDTTTGTPARNVTLTITEAGFGLGPCP